jgi:hypothetical protein
MFGCTRFWIFLALEISLRSIDKTKGLKSIDLQSFKHFNYMHLNEADLLFCGCTSTEPLIHSIDNAK